MYKDILKILLLMLLLQFEVQAVILPMPKVQQEEDLGYIDLEKLDVEKESNATGIKFIDEFLDLDKRPENILVGIVNMEGGYNELSGYEEGLSGRYKKGLWKEGRLSFYLKGLVKGEYLTQISYDSERGEDDIFDKVDPNKLYPVYGDLSEIDNSTAHTRGRLYVLIEKGESSYKWGEFKVDIKRTTLGRFNRSLYGSKLLYSPEAKGYGKSKVLAFESKLKERSTQGRYKLTGSDIYYMKHDDILYGTYKVNLLVLDSLNKEKIDELELIEGEDYELDYSRGKLSLLKDVIVKGSRKYIIGEGGLGIDNENTVYLDISYNYESVDDEDKSVRGYSILQDIGESGFSVGISDIKEDKIAGSYKSQVWDIKYKKGGLELLYEQGESESLSNEMYISSDGGLSFYDLDSDSDKKGKAKYYQGNYKGVVINIKSYYKDIEKGYSSLGIEKGIKDYGFDVGYTINSRSNISLAYDSLDKESEKKDVLRVQYKYIQKQWEMVLEYRKENKLDKSKDEKTKEDKFGFKGLYRFSERVKGHIEYQAQGKGNKKDAYGVGIEGKINEVFSVDGSVIKNDKGTKGVLSLIGEGSYKVSDNLSLKGRAKVSTDGNVDYSMRGLHSKDSKFEKDINKSIKVKGEHISKIEVDEKGELVDNSSSELGVGADYKLGVRKIKLSAVQKRTGILESDPVDSIRLSSEEKLGDYDLKVGSDYNHTKGEYKLEKYVGLGRKREDRSSELNVVLSEEEEGKRSNSLKLKDNIKLTDKLSLRSGLEYKESKNVRTGSKGYGNTYGGGLAYNGGYYEIDGKYERLDGLELSGKEVRREILGLGLSYTGYDRILGNESYKGNLRLQYRKDRGGEKIDQYRIRGSLKGWLDIRSHLYGKLDLSRTNNKKDDNKDRQDYRLDLGYSYRPVYEDKLNILSKISYIDNKKGDGILEDDFTSFGKEKGVVLGLELLYDISKKYEYVLKLGYRHTQEQVLDLALAKSDYWLLGNRISYKYDRDTKISLEYSKLNHKQGKNSRDGIILSLSRRFNDNIELEGGYKFDDVTEDLADLSYGIKGFFVRVTGAF